MNLGISIDTQESAEVIPFLNQWSDMLQHVQFYLNANLSRDEINRIRTVVDCFKTIFSYSFHAYGYLSLAEENNRIRAAWTDAGKENIDFLSDIGGKFINFHIGYTLSSSYIREKMLLRALESITVLCEYAVSKHIDFNIENDYSSEHIQRLGDRPEVISSFCANGLKIFIYVLISDVLILVSHHPQYIRKCLAQFKVSIFITITGCKMNIYR